jgi:hypothetical protein
LQTKDSNYLKKLTVKDLKEFLKEKANKITQSKTKKKLAKQLQQWHASIPRLRQASEGTVYDAYMMEHVPFDEFLEDENRIILYLQMLDVNEEWRHAIVEVVWQVSFSFWIV